MLIQFVRRLRAPRAGEGRPIAVPTVRIERKLGHHKHLPADVYATKITSFTKGKVYDVTVSKRFLQPEDRVLILDDFLANGCALEGLMDLVHQSGATLCGCGIAIEKGFQEGGKKIRAKGIRVESLAIIESMSGNSLTFSQREE